jgi:hypothetical protein
MQDVLWFIFPFVVALGSGVLSFIVAHARMQLEVGREREALVEARSVIAQSHRVTEEKIKAAEAEARRRALDEFLADVHVEERQYLKETQSEHGRSKSLVVQERIYFRSIPLSRWFEHELPVEERIGPGRTGSRYAVGEASQPGSDGARNGAGARSSRLIST